MNIYIASDHGGFNLKKQLVYVLVANLDFTGIVVNDLGPDTLDEDDDYPDYAFKVAEKVAEDAGSVGILICRSGNGMCIAANKVKGVYAALAFSSQHAKKAREDDNANVICLDADYEGEDPIEIVKAFIKSEFSSEERHHRRFQKIQDFENQS